MSKNKPKILIVGDPNKIPTYALSLIEKHEIEIQIAPKDMEKALENSGILNPPTEPEQPLDLLGHKDITYHKPETRRERRKRNRKKK